MEAKDKKLTKSLADCRKQKGDILRHITDISRQLRGKEKEINAIVEKQEELDQKFLELCPERSDKHDIIRAFFEKHVKRKAKKEVRERAEDEDDDDDDEDEAEEEEDDDEDEDEDENAIAGLSPEEYKIEEIEKLREQRLELIEDKTKIRDFIKGLDDKRKKLESQERAIKAELEETEEQIQDFESEKMSTLNELRMAVCLKMKQVQNLVPTERVEEFKAQHEAECRAKIQRLHERAQEEEMDEATLDRLTREIVQEADWRGYVLPRELKGSTLFTRTQLLQLIDRKREIDEECKDLRN